MSVAVALRRAAYRLAYAILRVYWYVWRPHVQGVKCVLTDGEQVLLVRHAYGPRTWDLPGGSIKRRESPANAATREMQEELGVWVPQWRPLGTLELVIDHRHDAIHCFAAELHAPELVIDRGELEAVRWFPLDRLPRVGRYTQKILVHAGAQTASR